MIGSLAAWRAYALDRGDEAPTEAADALATQALLRASDYITYSYVSRFVTPYDETSTGVETATYIAASLELATPNFFTTVYTPAQAKVLKKLDVMEWEVVGGDTSAAGQVPRSTAIEALLGRYLPVTGVLASYLRAVG